MRAIAPGALVLAIACACGGHAPPAATSAAVEAPRALAIEPASAEVWGFAIEVRGRAPDGATLASCRVRRGGAWTDARVDGATWTARVPLAPGANAVVAECREASGVVHRSPEARYLVPLADDPLARAEAAAGDGTRAPIDDAIIYGVVPPLFGSPPLAAVTRALPSLASLGATVVWLAPVFDAPPGDYGYAVTDYFRVRADYGTEDDLRALVGEAHRLGLRVILDVAANHTSSSHRYFQEASALGRASHYFAFYARDRDGAPTHYFDWAKLPNLDYANDEVDRWMLAATEEWLRTASVDGFRMDAAWGIRQRTPRFWPAWTRDVRSIAPRALLVAEASARDPYYVEHGFDLAYDWTEDLGHWAWDGVFDDPDHAGAKLAAALAASRGDPRRVLRFLENNDTGARFVTRHGAAETRAAAAALFTLPGVPALFTGQERGAEYEPYATRDPLPATDPHALRATYAALVALRRAHPSLQRGDFTPAAIDPPRPSALAFVRHDAASGETALVAIQLAPRAASVAITLPPGAPIAWHDVARAGEVRARAGRVTVKLDASSAAVLVAR